MNRKFLPLFLVLISFACHSPWNNSHSRVAVDCQVNRDESFKRYLRVFDENGEPLSQDRKSSLVAEFLDDAGRYQRPRITPGGCVEIPETDGELAVVESKSKSAVYWKTAATGDAFPSRRLMKRPNFTYESLCQGENRFANTQVKRDWSLTTDGSLQNIRLKVQARNVHDQSVAVLYQKNFGDELLLPDAWSTGMLREGQYHLEVFQHDLTDGLETAPRLVSFPALCPLTILHHAPTLLGLAGGGSDITVVDWEKGMDWTPAPNYVNAHVCMEERSAVDQDSSFSDVCQAVAHCQDSSQFKPMSRIRPEREGLYNVFVYAQDPAGNRSETACRVAVFSSQAPTFDLKWNKARWNKDGFVLDEPIPILKAQVSGLFHKDVPAAKLQQTLECKAEVILRSVETVTTPSITCTEGRCKGLPLDTFQPCDSAIGIGIFKYWRSQYSRHATLRIRVRASDTSQHIREKSLNVVLDGEQWQRHPIELPSAINLPPYYLAEDPEGHVLGLGAKYVGMWKDGKFVSISPGPGMLDPMRTKDDSLYFFVGEKPNELQVMRWFKGQWQTVGAPLDFADNYPSALPHPQKGLWLYTSDLTYLVQGDKISPAPRMPEEFGTATQTSIDESGRIWAFQQDRVYFLDPGAVWTRFSVPKVNDRAAAFEYSYWVDRFANLWMIVADKSSSPPLLADVIRMDGNEQQSYPELVQKVSHATRMADSFMLDASYSPILGKYRWSEKDFSWEINPLFEGISDHVDTAAFWNAQEMAWTTLEGRVYLEQEGQLKLLPLPMSFGETPFMASDKNVFVTGFEAFSHLEWRPWNERNAELDDLENVIGLWTGQNDKMRTCSTTLKIWEQHEGIWSRIMDVSALDSGMTLGCYEDSQSNLFLHTSTSIWWQPFGTTVPRKIMDSTKGKGPIGFVEDREGLVWFGCQDVTGVASLCSFDRVNVKTHPLNGQSFSSSYSRTCSLEVGDDLYFVDESFSAVYRRDSRQIEATSSRISFLDAHELSIDTCYRMTPSTSLISSDSMYYLWNNQNQELRVLDAFDSGLLRSHFMPDQITFQPSSDGYLYLMALEAKPQQTDSQLLSDRIKSGFVFRLSPDGTLTEIMKPDVRIRAFDQRNEMPQMLFSDRYGMLWGLSLSSIYWKQRLIQLNSPLSVGP